MIPAHTPTQTRAHTSICPIFRCLSARSEFVLYLTCSVQVGPGQLAPFIQQRIRHGYRRQRAPPAPERHGEEHAELRLRPEARDPRTMMDRAVPRRANTAPQDSAPATLSRIARRQGGCTGTAAGKEGIQQRTELAEDRVGDIHSCGRVELGGGRDWHWIVDRQRLLRSRSCDPAAKPNCANCGQRERRTQRGPGQVVRERLIVNMFRNKEYSSTSAGAPSASDTQVVAVTMLVKDHS